ncbi:MAG: ribosomal protein S18-alanine N-acetyltransferase [Oscillospiraceae bacterium]|nr:ribosomal protein S18-alanine N-acetyltransferase [Oscillospiraceae bacterium]
MMYHIVPMAGEHLEQVEAIERLCFPDPWSRRLLEELLGHAGAVALAAAGEEGTVLGYTSAQTVLDEGYINNVAVHPAYRRQGIASRLLEELRRRGAEMGLAFLTLEVRASNLAAQALYAKHGYREVGCRRNYYEHPKEDAILMTLEFENGTASNDAGGAGESV